jgi:hypothetical protein
LVLSSVVDGGTRRIVTDAESVTVFRPELNVAASGGTRGLDETGEPVNRRTGE